MKKYSLSIGLIILLLLSGNLFSQENPDSSSWKLRKQEFRKSLYLAIPLTAAGIIAKSNNNFFSNSIFEDARNKHFSTFTSNLDDYLIYAPIGAVFLIDAFDKTARNSIGNQALVLIKSELIMSALVFPMKSISKQVRPDGSDDQSFPSGHTAQAFLTATFLHKEFGHKSIWYSIVGYTAASSVGVFRVLNNKHFVNDVLVGASVGVLSTNLAYLIHQNRWGKKRDYHLSLTPIYLQKRMGVHLAYQF